jgi:hypothetical protein
MTCNEIDSAINACIDGLGLGMFLSYMVAPYRKAGQLKYVLEKFETEPMPVLSSIRKRGSCRTRCAPSSTNVSESCGARRLIDERRLCWLLCGPRVLPHGPSYRPSSTLPSETSTDVCYTAAFGGNPDIEQTSPNDRV